MKPKLLELKEELKHLAENIKVLKTQHKVCSRLGHYLNPYALRYGYYYSVGLKFWLEETDWINVSRGSSIPTNIVTLFEKANRAAIKDHCILITQQFLYRHLSIVYGLLRGKTREYMEPKWKENPSPYNPITGKHIGGKDPIDWNFISELQKKYSENYVESLNSGVISGYTVSLPSKVNIT